MTITTSTAFITSIATAYPSSSVSHALEPPSAGLFSSEQEWFFPNGSSVHHHRFEHNFEMVHSSPSGTMLVPMPPTPLPPLRTIVVVLLPLRSILFPGLPPLAGAPPFTGLPALLPPAPSSLMQSTDRHFLLFNYTHKIIKQKVIKFTCWVTSLIILVFQAIQIKFSLN